MSEEAPETPRRRWDEDPPWCGLENSSRPGGNACASLHRGYVVDKDYCRSCDFFIARKNRKKT